MMQAIIVDLDGTLCDNTHRQHYMTNSPKNWKAFYEGIPGDKLADWCYKILAAMAGSTHFLLVSGRPDAYRPQTEKWLEENGIGYTALHMRKEGDFRDDFIVKQEIYEEHIKPFYNVLFAIDDRKQVVDMWRRVGLVCLQCAEGNF